MLERCLLIFIVLFSSEAFSSAHMCGNKIVREGESTQTVRSQCGEPENISYSNSTESWRYNPGVGYFYKIFLFQNNVLVGVHTGNRVNKVETFQSAEQKGCCSWHKGVCGCKNGRVLCCDGNFSPSCRCPSD